MNEFCCCDRFLLCNIYSCFVFLFFVFPLTLISYLFILQCIFYNNLFSKNGYSSNCIQNAAMQCKNTELDFSIFFFRSDAEQKLKICWFFKWNAPFDAIEKKQISRRTPHRSCFMHNVLRNILSSFLKK